MKTEHTPTPWTLGQDGHLNYVINDTESKAIAVTKSHVVQSSGLAFRNAAFIVRACNSHDDLIKVIRSFLIHGTIEEVIDRAHEILAKAEGEA